MLSRTVHGVALLFGFISLGVLGGCGSDSGGRTDTQALTENDFAERSSVFAAPDRGIIVDFLEPTGTETPEIDTGDVGVDVIRYRYTRPTRNTFCWEDDNQGADDYMTLVDSGGAEVLTAEVNGDCVTGVFEEGEYEMRLYHGEGAEEILPIFIEAEADTDGVIPGLI